MAISIKECIFRVLNGMSLAIIAALVPSALIGELAKAMEWTVIMNASIAITSLVSIFIGIGVAYQFSLKPLKSLSIGIATFIGSGVYRIVNGNVIIRGPGDVINAGLTAGIALLILYFVKDKIETLRIIVYPLIVGVGGGILGLFCLPIVSKITGAIGLGITKVVTLQPLLMGGLLAVIFAIVIVSPLSSVGLAHAVALSGISSGTANLGICACGFSLCVLGYKANGLGTSLVSVLGSPKIHMTNFVKKPLIMLPICINAFVVGVVGAMFNMKGTAISAGFGLLGLIGPINALNLSFWSYSNIVLVISIYILLPAVLAVVSNVVFIKKLKLLKIEDYKVNV